MCQSGCFNISSAFAGAGKKSLALAELLPDIGIIVGYSESDMGFFVRIIGVEYMQGSAPILLVPRGILLSFFVQIICARFRMMNFGTDENVVGGGVQCGWN